MIRNRANNSFETISCSVSGKWEFYMQDNECIKWFMEDLIAKNIKHTILVLVRKAGLQLRLFKND